MKMLPPTFGPPSSVFGDDTSKDKLSTGITISYPILRIKGKVWSITRGANEPFQLMRPDGDGPRNSIDVVIVAASQHISKVWYESGYIEGNTNPPDCFAPNGVVPDASSPKKQHNTCAGCPQNAWGSAITAAGKKAKACRDSKRIAVAPLGDIRNEAFGGPMLLRIPATSLTEFGNYGDGMEARGYKYFTIGTKMSFDATEAYPKIIFEPIRRLEDDEARAVLELRASQAVQSIMAADVAVDLEEAVVDVKLPANFQEPAPNVEAAPAHKVTPKVTTPPPPPPAAKTTPLPPPPSPVGAPASDGFGGSEPTKAASPNTSKPKRAQAAAPPPSSEPRQPPAHEAETAADGSFEASLDADMEELLSET